jgi:uncharacterized protein (UPF0332 family)
MKVPSALLWERALTALASARILLPTDPEGAASRAYYASFYAVSALFALEEKYYSRHSALRAALHKELIHGGRWPEERGRDYRLLYESREAADYGDTRAVSEETGQEAIAAAGRILQEVSRSQPDLFLLRPNALAKDPDRD